MRINRLTVQGFGPYKTAQHVDFDAFADDGIFLMGGKTGAGKSSILDAICFALYDSVPRYDGTKSRLRSDHAGPDDASLVALEFTVSGTRYRVERTPEYERLKARGTGTTTQKSEATLSELQGAEWVGIEAGPRNVGPHIAELVGLNKDQFLQVILLAQNRFQQFLLAKSEARQEVLRSLFGTRRFQDYEFALTEKRKALDADMSARRAALAQMVEQAASVARSAEVQPELLEIPALLTAELLTPWLTGLTDAAHALVRTALDHTETADAQFAAADAAHDAKLALQAAQLRQAAALQKLDELRAESGAIESDRAALAEAARADVAWGTVSAASKAHAALDAATETLALATTQYTALAGSAHADATPAGAVKGSVPDSAALAQLIERTTHEQGALNETLALERELPALRSTLERLTQTHKADEANLAEAIARAAALPALIASDTERLGELRLAAAQLNSATSERERLAQTLAHAQRVSGLQPRLAVAREDELAAGQASTAASARLDELRARRLNGQAAELASGLRDGEACAVCGSLEHPHPAAAAADAVAPEDIDGAEAELERRRTAAEQANAAAQALESELAAATALAGSLTGEQLAAQIVDADAAIAAASEAAQAAAALATQLEQRTNEQKHADSTVTVLRETLTLTTNDVTAAHTRMIEAEKRVAEQRAGFDSIAARSDALAHTLRSARTLAEAQLSAATASASARDAEATLHEQLEKQGFESASAVSAAHLDQPSRSALELRVRTHDNALAAATATLAEPELADLPREAVQLDETEAALSAARTARDEALTARATVSTRAGALTELARAIEAELAASADLIERYEIVARLAATIKGDAPNDRRMRLESFVLAAELEEIVDAANVRLHAMSGGRYALEHDDSIGYRGTQSGLGLVILDSHTGLNRPTHSLSGGETFLASLALALGLAEVVTGRAGGITLDTLFIDEGFGSLDADTLEIAMATLDSLRTGGRTIGLISHVEAMKEQIHASLQVRVSEHGWSTISQDVA